MLLTPYNASSGSAPSPPVTHRGECEGRADDVSRINQIDVVPAEGGPEHLVLTGLIGARVYASDA